MKWTELFASHLKPFSLASTMCCRRPFGFSTRGGEHIQRYLKKKDKSFMTEHQQKRHKGELANFSFKVTRTFQEPLSRQTDPQLQGRVPHASTLGVEEGGDKRPVTLFIGCNNQHNFPDSMDKLTGRLCVYLSFWKGLSGETYPIKLSDVQIKA